MEPGRRMVLYFKASGRAPLPSIMSKDHKSFFLPTELSNKESMDWLGSFYLPEGGESQCLVLGSKDGC